MKLFLTAALAAPTQTPKLRTENVVLITLDGMRWQEVFGGADTALFRQSKYYYTDQKALRKDFGQATPAQRSCLSCGVPWPGRASSTATDRPAAW